MENGALDKRQTMRAKEANVGRNVRAEQERSRMSSWALEVREHVSAAGHTLFRPPELMSRAVMCVSDVSDRQMTPFLSSRLAWLIPEDSRLSASCPKGFAPLLLWWVCVYVQRKWKENTNRKKLHFFFFLTAHGFPSHRSDSGWIQSSPIMLCRRNSWKYSRRWLKGQTENGYKGARELISAHLSCLNKLY